MTPQRDESGFRPNLRVRIGVTGPTGYLRHCEKRDKSGWYWKVKLDTGELAWPEDLVIDGPGEIVNRCARCEMRFMAKTDEPVCPPCDEEMFGASQRQAETGHPTGGIRHRGYQRGSR